MCFNGQNLEGLADEGWRFVPRRSHGSRPRLQAPLHPRAGWNRGWWLTWPGPYGFKNPEMVRLGKGQAFENKS